MLDLASTAEELKIALDRREQKNTLSLLEKRANLQASYSGNDDLTRLSCVAVRTQKPSATDYFCVRTAFLMGESSIFSALTANMSKDAIECVSDGIKRRKMEFCTQLFVNSTYVRLDL